MALLSGGRFLTQLNKQSTLLGALLQNLIDAHNHVAAQVGVDPVGQAPAPPPINSVTPTVIGEQLHVRVLDNAPTNRARAYFSEIYADADRTQLLHVEHHGASRDASIALPSKDSTGATTNYYLSSYSQTPGSPPSQRVDYTAPIQMVGATQGALPPSAGSGTGSANGTQPGQGYGNFPSRKATGVVRSV